ncbi:MAG: DUF5617 domain-containing protein [Pseudomonadota bacterium]
MIKQKRDLPQEKNSFVNSQTDFFLNHFTPPFEDEHSKQVYKDARRRLEVMRDAKRNSVTKENVSPSEEKQADLASQQLEPFSQENLLATPAASSTAQESADEKKDLSLFLKEIVDFRIKNQLIYGNKERVDSQADKQWGVGASKTAGYYLRDLKSTIIREEGGWCEFVITYDNKIILNNSIKSAEGHLKFNHLSMGCGTFLKAAGRLKIEDGKLTIWPSSEYLELGSANINIILFVLHIEGFPVENIDIFDEKRGSMSWIGDDGVNEFFLLLDETYFPLAKAIAENKKVSIQSSLSELFLDIDDEILSTRSQKLIKTMNVNRAELKADIIELLLLMTEDASEQDKEINDEKATNAVGQAIQCYKKIEGAIQVFKLQNIDLSFINKEVFSWFFYLKQLQLQISELEIEDTKKLLVEELAEVERSLKKIKASSTVPQRFKESHEVVTPFIKFYNENPFKTCIRLLYDYTKGGAIKRFLSGAWNRHHIQAVTQFLKKYETCQLADNHSIQAIYQELFGVTNGLNENTDKRGTLYARLLFCAALANEIPVENQNRISVVMEETNEISNRDIQEREPIADSIPLPVPSGTPSGVLLENSPIESPQRRSSPRSNEKSTFFKLTKSENAASSETLNRENSPTGSSFLSSILYGGTP